MGSHRRIEELVWTGFQPGAYSTLLYITLQQITVQHGTAPAPAQRHSKGSAAFNCKIIIDNYTSILIQISQPILAIHSQNPEKKVYILILLNIPFQKPQERTHSFLESFPFYI